MRLGYKGGMSKKGNGVKQETAAEKEACLSNVESRNGPDERLQHQNKIVASQCT